MPWTPPAHDRTIELRDHLPPASWRVPMAEICGRHGIDAETLAPLSSGSDVVWSAHEVVIKLTAPCWESFIVAESRWLTSVRGRLGVRIPEVRAMGELRGWGRTSS